MISKAQINDEIAQRKLEHQKFVLEHLEQAKKQINAVTVLKQDERIWCRSSSSKGKVPGNEQSKSPSLEENINQSEINI